MVTLNQIRKSLIWCFTPQNTSQHDKIKARNFAIGLITGAIFFKFFNLLSRNNCLITTSAGTALLAGTAYPVPALTAGPHLILISQTTYVAFYNVIKVLKKDK